MRVHYLLTVSAMGHREILLSLGAVPLLLMDVPRKRCLLEAVWILNILLCQITVGSSNPRIIHSKSVERVQYRSKHARYFIYCRILLVKCSLVGVPSNATVCMHPCIHRNFLSCIREFKNMAGEVESLKFLKTRTQF